MNDALRKKANDAYQAALAKYQPGKKSEIANARAQSFAGIDFGNSFCEDAPKAIDGIIKEIDTWSWAIPDKIERPGLAVLEAIKAILPEFCAADTGAADTGTETGATTVGGKRK